MSGNAEWGEWQEHDGKGCPCNGMCVEVIKRDGSGKGGTIRSRSVMTDSSNSAWVWDESRPDWLRLTEIIRYRIRKPRGLTILEGLLENLPEEVPA